MKLPIAQAVGKIIKCPECGHAAPVKPAQNHVSPHVPASPAIITAMQWYEVTCPKSGRKLYPAREPVEVVEGPSHV